MQNVLSSRENIYKVFQPKIFYMQSSILFPHNRTKKKKQQFIKTQVLVFMLQ